MDEVMVAHTDWNFRERKERAISGLNDVGVEGESVYDQYPFQVSGGQLQKSCSSASYVTKAEVADCG